MLVIQLTLHSIRQHKLFSSKQGYMFRLNVGHLQALTIFCEVRILDGCVIEGGGG